jgi:hypothetical protein
LGDRGAARLAIEAAAAAAGLSEEVFVEAVEEEIRRRLCVEAVSFCGGRRGPAVAELADDWFPRPGARPPHPLDLRVSLALPVVGGGAPAAAFLPGAFGRLGAGCVLPEA